MACIQGRRARLLVDGRDPDDVALRRAERDAVEPARVVVLAPPVPHGAVHLREASGTREKEAWTTRSRLYRGVSSWTP